MNFVSLKKFVLIAIMQIDEQGEDVNEHKFTKTCCIDTVFGMLKKCKFFVKVCHFFLDPKDGIYTLKAVLC